jgi:hypothetical protein
MRTLRRIGPVGTGTRLVAGAALIYSALYAGTSWRLTWYDAALGIVVLPGFMIALGLGARMRHLGPLDFTSTLGVMLNCAAIVALVSNRYTAVGTELFYGATLVLAAWRAQPGCEATVISNAILKRDDQIGCPIFTPIDRAEAPRRRKRNDSFGRQPRLEHDAERGSSG